MSMKYSGLVLAAGKGTRFQKETGSAFPKVLRPVLGRPMVSYVLEAMNGAGISDITLIVGFGADEVIREVGTGVRYAVQQEQKGSGHAVKCAADAFKGYDGGIVVMCGDSPMFRAGTVNAIMNEHEEKSAVVTLASAMLDDPCGYGRIVRGVSGEISAIVEEKCADEQERAIKEVNGGAYAFDAAWLFGNIDKMVLNEAGEYNLTDMVRVAIEQGRTVAAVLCDPKELLGVNTPAQLEFVEKLITQENK